MIGRHSICIRLYCYVTNDHKQNNTHFLFHSFSTGQDSGLSFAGPSAQDLTRLKSRYQLDQVLIWSLGSFSKLIQVVGEMSFLVVVMIKVLLAVGCVLLLAPKGLPRSSPQSPLHTASHNIQITSSRPPGEALTLVC